MCVQNSDQFVCAALGKPFKSSCSWRKAMGNHLHIGTAHVYDGASAMTMSLQTCLRAENSSSSYHYRLYNIYIYIYYILIYRIYITLCVSRIQSCPDERILTQLVLSPFVNR